MQVIRAAKSDSRLANSNLPLDIQKLRCRACYQALRFAPTIEAMGKVVSRLNAALVLVALFFSSMILNQLLFLIVVGGANEGLWSLHCFAFKI